MSTKFSYESEIRLKVFWTPKTVLEMNFPEKGLNSRKSVAKVEDKSRQNFQLSRKKSRFQWKIRDNLVLFGIETNKTK